MVGSCRVELRAEASGLQPPYPVPGLKLPIGFRGTSAHPGGIEPLNEGLKGPCRSKRLSFQGACSRPTGHIAQARMGVEPNRLGN